MGFWKALMNCLTEDYAESSKNKKKDPSFFIDITPSKKKSDHAGRHINEIIQATNTGKDLRPGEAKRILRLMMPENPIDQFFEDILHKRGDLFLPEMNSDLLKQNVFVVDFKQNDQPKKWENDVRFYTSQKRLDQGQDFRYNVSLNFPTTKMPFQEFLRDLMDGAIVTVNSMTPAAGCFEWRGGKFAYRGLPKQKG